MRGVPERTCASGDLGQFRAPAVQQSVRGAKLVTYSCGMSTMPIRGIAAILSERLTARAVEGGVQVCVGKPNSVVTETSF